MGCPRCTGKTLSASACKSSPMSFSVCNCSKTLGSTGRKRVVRIVDCQGSIDCGNKKIGNPFQQANSALLDSGITQEDPDHLDLNRRVSLGCPTCVPQQPTICGQAEIGGRHFYIDFHGITGETDADRIEQIFLDVINKYSATTFQCYSSVAGTDYYDHCERPRFESEFYHNGRIDYGVVTYLFSKKYRIEAEQLAILITNDINIAISNAGMQVTAEYRF